MQQNLSNADPNRKKTLRSTSTCTQSQVKLPNPQRKTRAKISLISQKAYGSQGLWRCHHETSHKTNRWGFQGSQALLNFSVQLWTTASSWLKPNLYWHDYALVIFSTVWEVARVKMLKQGFESSEREQSVTEEQGQNRVCPRTDLLFRLGKPLYGWLGGQLWPDIVQTLSKHRQHQLNTHSDRIWLINRCCMRSYKKSWHGVGVESVNCKLASCDAILTTHACSSQCKSYSLNQMII